MLGIHQISEMDIHSIANLHNGALLYVIVTCFALSSAFLLPSQSRQGFHRSSLIGSNQKFQNKIRNRVIVKGGFNSFDNDDLFDDDIYDEEGETIYFEKSLTDDEKKQMIKDYFNKAFNYDGAVSRPDEVHIILFNPNTVREGAHSINILGNNIILAFESKIECEQFSSHLKEQNFFEPVVSKIMRLNLFPFYMLMMQHRLLRYYSCLKQPQPINLDALERYCKQIRVDVQVVPKGAKLRPPSQQVFNLDMNPNLEKEIKQLDYLFQMSESELGDTCIDEEELGAWE